MKVTVAATQMACGWDRDANIANAERLIQNALQSVDAAHRLRPFDHHSFLHWQRGRRRLLARLAYTRLSNLDRAGARAALHDAWTSGGPRDARSLGLFAMSLLPLTALRGLHQVKRLLP
jgi:hypothetical protein